MPNSEASNYLATTKKQQGWRHIPPRQLFLIDGLGALLSAFMLGIVLVQLESYFGMPRPLLYRFAGIALVFSSYSLICYWRLKQRWNVYLFLIAFANLSYCCLTGVYLLLLWDQLTILGLFYFIIEILIVVLLAGIEISVAARSK